MESVLTWFCGMLRLVEGLGTAAGVGGEGEGGGTRHACPRVAGLHLVHGPVSGHSAHSVALQVCRLKYDTVMLSKSARETRTQLSNSKSAGETVTQLPKIARGTKTQLSISAGKTRYSYQCLPVKQQTKTTES